MTDIKVKLSQAQAGKLYMKALKLEDENKEMRVLIKEASDYLDTNNLTSIGHGSILHRKLKALGGE